MNDTEPTAQSCPSCGATCLAASSFCHKCGKPLPPEVSACEALLLNKMVVGRAPTQAPETSVASPSSRSRTSSEPKSVKRPLSIGAAVSGVLLVILLMQTLSQCQQRGTLAEVNQLPVGTSVTEFRRAFPRAREVPRHKISNGSQRTSSSTALPWRFGNRRIFELPPAWIPNPLRDQEKLKFYFFDDRLVFWAPESRFEGEAAGFEATLPDPYKSPNLEKHLRQRGVLPPISGSSNTGR